jgi:hypothetical protein
MPETGIKRAPIKDAPRSALVTKWGECLRLTERLIDIEFAISLQSEALILKAMYAQSAGVPLVLPGAESAEQRYLLFRKTLAGIQDAVARVQTKEYGLKWRDNDFDIISPDPAMGALFIPLMIGAVILAGCFMTLYHMGESSDKLLADYKVLNKSATDTLCKDPNSALCKGWNVVKTQNNIEEKESFADSLKGGLAKGLSIGLAVVIGLFALSSFMRKI